MNQNAVESALDILRPGLNSDGFELRAGASEDGVVQVILEAKPEACLDCLVPEKMMMMIITDEIRKHDPSLERVELLKVGFESLADH